MIIVVGHETNALTLFWVCTLLAKAPRWQAALAAEASRLDLSVEGAAASPPKLAAEGSGFGVAYPEPLFLPGRGWEHRNGVSGQRLPDLDLVLADGSRKALYRFLEDRRWVLLQAAPDKETTWDAEWIKSVNLSPAPNEGLLANFGSVLVRPDGYLGHVRPADGASNAEKASEIAA